MQRVDLIFDTYFSTLKILFSFSIFTYLVLMITNTALKIVLKISGWGDDWAISSSHGQDFMR